MWNIIIMSSLLLLCAIEDFVKKEVNLLLIILFFVVGITVNVYSGFIDGRINYVEIFFSILIMGFLFLISYISKERVGMADALITGSMCFYTGILDSFINCWIACLICMIVGVVGMVSKRLKKDTRIAYIPFLFAAVVFRYLVIPLLS